MTAPGWRRSIATASSCGSGPAGCRVLEELLDRELGAGDLRDQPHPLGDSRAGHRPQRPSPSGWAAAATVTVAVVHNGVIENHAALRSELESQGFTFVSQTDSEAIAHLIARELETVDDLFEAVQRALPRLEGTYGLAVVSPKRPGEVIGARFGSPLVVGLGEGEHLLASDPVAIAPHTARVAFLQDGEVVRLTTETSRSAIVEHGPITPRVDRIDWKPDAVELGGHAHYMIKEIREQPETVINACRGRLRRDEATAQFGGLNLSARQLRRVRAGRPGGVRNKLARGPRRRVPDRAARSSARRGRIRQRVPLSQRTARRPDPRLRAQPVGRDGRYLGRAPRGEAPRAPHAGDREYRRQHHRPRGRRRHLSPRRARGRRRQHQGIFGPGDRAAPLGALSRSAAGISRSRTAWPSWTRSNRFPACWARSSRPSPSSNRPPSGFARPGVPFFSVATSIFRSRSRALKLKEISYIHAEGYPTAEMKHGPIALVDRETPCVFVAPRGSLHAKTLSNLEEVKARNGTIITVGTEGDSALEPLVRHVPAGSRRARGRSAAPGRRAAPVAGLSCRAATRLRYRQAAQSGQERDGGVSDDVPSGIERGKMKARSRID